MAIQRWLRPSDGPGGIHPACAEADGRQGCAAGHVQQPDLERAQPCVIAQSSRVALVFNVPVTDSPMEIASDVGSLRGSARARERPALPPARAGKMVRRHTRIFGTRTGYQLCVHRRASAHDLFICMRSHHAAGPIKISLSNAGQFVIKRVQVFEGLASILGGSRLSRVSCFSTPA
jgi:hypothetical protein